MGKGDIKTKRGKIFNKSFGVRRKRNSEKIASVTKPVIIEKPISVVEKKTAPKKTSKKTKGETAS